VLRPAQPSGGEQRGEFRRGGDDPAAGDQGRLPPLRTELLPPLPTRGAARRGARHLDRPHRLPLRRAGGGVAARDTRKEGVDRRLRSDATLRMGLFNPCWREFRMRAAPLFPMQIAGEVRLLGGGPRLIAERTLAEAAVLVLASQPSAFHRLSGAIAQCAAHEVQNVAPNEQSSGVLQTHSADLQGFSMGGTGLEPVTPSLSSPQSWYSPFAQVGRYCLVCRTFRPLAARTFTRVAPLDHPFLLARVSTAPTPMPRSWVQGAGTIWTH
jgi:hypothetical protein